jgi:HEPN domain-containing protein/predicted nucleotidyltransferase
MKTSLDHLPLPKQEQLRAITALIRAGAPVEMLVLFGSHARGDWVSDPSGPYFSDYDLMAVVREPQVAKDEALWASLEQQAQAISGRTPVSLIAHDIKHINKELRDAQYFFSDVFTEGILLYDSRGVHLAKVRAGTKEERLRYAERGFAYWFDSASVFLQGCAVYMQSGHTSHAAFCLHQAAERYYHAVMLVFTNYKAKIHNLEQMGEQAAALHPDLHESLPKTTEEDRHLFSLLKRAYIESRYSMSFRISQEELVVLKERVRRLGQLVRRLSIERLGTYLGPEAVSRDLPDVPPEEAALAGDLPPAPEEEGGFAAWRQQLVDLSFQRGVAKGRDEGKRLGLDEGKRLGLDEGKRLGEAKGKAEAILMVLRSRGFTLSEEMAARIVACQDSEQLTRWLLRAVTLARLEDLFTP